MNIPTSKLTFFDNQKPDDVKELFYNKAVQMTITGFPISLAEYEYCNSIYNAIATTFSNSDWYTPQSFVIKGFRVYDKRKNPEHWACN